MYDHDFEERTFPISAIHTEYKKIRRDLDSPIEFRPRPMKNGSKDITDIIDEAFKKSKLAEGAEIFEKILSDANRTAA